MATPHEPPLPNFILAGAPKAGTTSLYRYLGQHPQIYVSPIKEPTFFGAEDILRRTLDQETARVVARHRRMVEQYLAGPMDQSFMVAGPVLDWEGYLKLFRNATTETAIGEGSVSYLWLPSAAAAIYDRVPNARLIFMLRDPAEQAFSLYLSAYRHQHQSFSQAYRSAINDPEGPRKDWLEVARYGSHLQRFLNTFPREQLLFLLYDDYRRDPQATLRSIYSFLGVDPDFQPDFSRRHNEPSVVRFPVLHKLRWKLFGKTHLTRYIPGRIRDLVSRLYTRPRADVSLSPDDRRLVIDYHRTEIVRTSDLVGRDLTAWLR